MLEMLQRRSSSSYAPLAQLYGSQSPSISDATLAALRSKLAAVHEGQTARQDEASLPPARTLGSAPEHSFRNRFLSGKAAPCLDVWLASHLAPPPGGAVLTPPSYLSWDSDAVAEVLDYLCTRRTDACTAAPMMQQLGLVLLGAAPSPARSSPRELISEGVVARLNHCLTSESGVLPPLQAHNGVLASSASASSHAWHSTVQAAYPDLDVAGDWEWFSCLLGSLHSHGLLDVGVLTKQVLEPLVTADVPVTLQTMQVVLPLLKLAMSSRALPQPHLRVQVALLMRFLAALTQIASNTTPSAHRTPLSTLLSLPAGPSPAPSPAPSPGPPGFERRGLISIPAVDINTLSQLLVPIDTNVGLPRAAGAVQAATELLTLLCRAVEGASAFFVSAQGVDGILEAVGDRRLMDAAGAVCAESDLGDRSAAAVSHIRAEYHDLCRVTAPRTSFVKQVTEKIVGLRPDITATVSALHQLWDSSQVYQAAHIEPVVTWICDWACSALYVTRTVKTLKVTGPASRASPSEEAKKAASSYSAPRVVGRDGAKPPVPSNTTTTAAAAAAAAAAPNELRALEDVEGVSRCLYALRLLRAVGVRQRAVMLGHPGSDTTSPADSRAATPALASRAEPAVAAVTAAMAAFVKDGEEAPGADGSERATSTPPLQCFNTFCHPPDDVPVLHGALEAWLDKSPVLDWLDKQAYGFSYDADLVVSHVAGAFIVLLAESGLISVQRFVENCMALGITMPLSNASSGSTIPHSHRRVWVLQQLSAQLQPAFAPHLRAHQAMHTYHRYSGTPSPAGGSPLPSAEPSPSSTLKGELPPVDTQDCGASPRSRPQSDTYSAWLDAVPSLAKRSGCAAVLDFVLNGGSAPRKRSLPGASPLVHGASAAKRARTGGSGDLTPDPLGPPRDSGDTAAAPAAALLRAADAFQRFLLAQPGVTEPRFAAACLRRGARLRAWRQRVLAGWLVHRLSSHGPEALRQALTSLDLVSMPSLIAAVDAASPRVAGHDEDRRLGEAAADLAALMPRRVGAGGTSDACLAAHADAHWVVQFAAALLTLRCDALVAVFVTQLVQHACTSRSAAWGVLCACLRATAPSIDALGLAPGLADTIVAAAMRDALSSALRAELLLLVVELLRNRKADLKALARQLRRGSMSGADACAAYLDNSATRDPVAAAIPDDQLIRLSDRMSRSKGSQGALVQALQAVLRRSAANPGTADKGKAVAAVVAELRSVADSSDGAPVRDVALVGAVASAAVLAFVELRAGHTASNGAEDTASYRAFAFLCAALWRFAAETDLSAANAGPLAVPLSAVTTVAVLEACVHELTASVSGSGAASSTLALLQFAAGGAAHGVMHLATALPYLVARVAKVPGQAADSARAAPMEYIILAALLGCGPTHRLAGRAISLATARSNKGDDAAQKLPFAAEMTLVRRLQRALPSEVLACIGWGSHSALSLAGAALMPTGPHSQIARLAVNQALASDSTRLALLLAAHTLRVQGPERLMAVVRESKAHPSWTLTVSLFTGKVKTLTAVAALDWRAELTRMLAAPQPAHCGTHARVVQSAIDAATLRVTLTQAASVDAKAAVDALFARTGSRPNVPTGVADGVGVALVTALLRSPRSISVLVAIAEAAEQPVVVRSLFTAMARGIKADAADGSQAAILMGELPLDAALRRQLPERFEPLLAHACASHEALAPLYVDGFLQLLTLQERGEWKLHADLLVSHIGALAEVLERKATALKLRDGAGGASGMLGGSSTGGGAGGSSAHADKPLRASLSARRDDGAGGGGAGSAPLELATPQIGPCLRILSVHLDLVMPLLPLVYNDSNKTLRHKPMRFALANHTVRLLSSVSALTGHALPAPAAGATPVNASGLLRRLLLVLHMLLAEEWPSWLCAHQDRALQPLGAMPDLDQLYHTLSRQPLPAALAITVASSLTESLPAIVASGTPGAGEASARQEPPFAAAHGLFRPRLAGSSLSGAGGTNRDADGVGTAGAKGNQADAWATVPGWRNTSVAWSAERSVHLRGSFHEILASVHAQAVKPPRFAALADCLPVGAHR